MKLSRICLGLAAAMLALSLAGLTPTQSHAQTLVGGRDVAQVPPGFARSCDRYAWLCSNQAAGHAARTVSLDRAELLDVARRINRSVNRQVTEVSDPEHYGIPDLWTLPRNNKGDCEDFVLLKYKLLLDAGVDSRELSIAVVLTRRGENHAVLLLRHGSGDLVLDSLSSGIVPWNETGYRFLAMQSRDDKTKWQFVAKSSKDSSTVAAR